MRRRAGDRRPTIKEVAKLADVSFKTVARVVNNEPSVTGDKREAVLRAMKMLNYVPNVSARQLASNRSFLIALLFDLAADYVAKAQAGAITRCREAGYHLLVEEVPAGFEAEIAKRLSAVRVDGVILTAPLSRNADLIAALRQEGLRYVLISPEDPDPVAPSVSMDDHAAAFEMTRLLIELGHRDIGFIGAGQKLASRRRQAGFLAALEAAGLPRRPELEAHGDFFFPSGETGAEALLGGDTRPTAIFAANDAMALGAMVCAARLGIRVPADLSIVGFDDISSAAVVSPQLTTVRPPMPAMAAAAVDLLLEREPPADPPVLTFAFEIIRRGSTAPPP